MPGITTPSPQTPKSPKLKPAQKPKHLPYRKVSMKNNSTGTPTRAPAACTPPFDPCERVCEIDTQSLPQFMSPSHCLPFFPFSDQSGPTFLAGKDPALARFLSVHQSRPFTLPVGERSSLAVAYILADSLIWFVTLKLNASHGSPERITVVLLFYFVDVIW